jgi:ditrans,polycis-polyprenyl diphosphate synthase
MVGQHRLRVRVVGDLSLAPRDVQAAAAETMRVSAERWAGTGAATVDILFAYTATYELARLLAGKAACAHGCVATGQCGCLTGSAFEGALVAGSPPVDLLIRTSGESRLSDFLVWQSAGAQLAWVPSLWPGFSFLSFVNCVLSFQKAWSDLSAIRRAQPVG